MPVKTINPQESKDIKNIKKLSHIREMKTKEILKIGNPELLSKEGFLVPSNNGIDRYEIRHLDSWSCECKDFKEHFREKGIYCKHIKAMQQFLKLKNSAEIENFDVIGLNGENTLECPTCKSVDITKQGYRINKNSKKHKYFCGNCSRYFVNEPVKYIKGNTQPLCLAMDCYYKGLSLRDIQDTFKQFYCIRLHHETIRRWIMKFTEKINQYVETETAEQWLNGMKLYHNFIKPPSDLKGLTHSQKANIGLNLWDYRWAGLLKRSVEK